MKNWLLACCFGLLACAGSGDDGGSKDDAPIPDGPGSQSCGETNPEINAFSIEYVGMREFDEGLFPTLGLTIDATDEDGDLDYYEYRIWWDDQIDGVVSTEGFYAETYGTVDEDECSVTSVSLTMYLGIAGGAKSPPLSTELEFGAVVRDDKGNESGNGTPTVQVFTTPDSDGNF